MFLSSLVGRCGYLGAFEIRDEAMKACHMILKSDSCHCPSHKDVKASNFLDLSKNDKNS